MHHEKDRYRESEGAEAVTRADIPIRTAEELAKVEDQNTRQDLIAQVIKGALGREGVRQARTVRSADTYEDPSLQIPANRRWTKTDYREMIQIHHEMMQAGTSSLP